MNLTDLLTVAVLAFVGFRLADAARQTFSSRGHVRQIVAGLRNSLQVSVILMVVSEWIASTGGIGYFIVNLPNSAEGGVISRFADEVFPLLGLKQGVAQA